jgi:hypothetical protein
MVVPFCLKNNSDWSLVYIPSADRLVRGEDIYQGAFVYPPINAWLAIPFAYIPNIPGRLIWLSINLIGLIVLIRSAWKLSGGSRLDGDPPVARREHGIFAIGLLCGGAYILDSLTTQQTDLVVAAIVLVGCRALVGGRPLRAGLLFGLAAGLKCTPLLWAPYLLWRRQWAAAIAVPLVAIAMNLVPELTHPSPGSSSRLEQWVQRYLTPMSNEKHDIGVWATAINFNHSVNGVVNRMLVWERVWVDGTETMAPVVDRASPATLRLVAGGILLFFLVIAVASAWRARTRLANGANANSEAPSIETLEFCLVLLLMVLMSPHSSKPHFCTLVLPGFCLARLALVRRDWLLWAIVIGAAACGLVINKDLVGKPVYSWLKWYGCVTWGAVLLFLGCCWALIQKRDTEPVST